MLNFIDNFLNRETMYRLVLYYLIFLFAVAAVFSLFGILPYSLLAMAFSGSIILFVCWITNIIFAHIFNASVNIESMYITALILALIIAPPSSADYLSNFPFLIWASIWAMASKYIFAVHKKHIFNPAAFAVALTAISINQSANWWISSFYMLPFVIGGGLLVIRKTKKAGLIASFFITAVLAILGFNFLDGINFIILMKNILFYTPILFFAFVIITEPITAPSGKIPRIFYGVIVGFLFTPSIHIGPIYSTPELALLIGNIFAFIINPKGKHILRLKEKIQVVPETYDFLFSADRKIMFYPGQYMEWTLPHKHSDNRGNRRYFTIASSPTERDIRLGIKIFPDSSSFKRKLISMDAGREITASQLAGDFILPKDKNQKLVFIAGGIGITPFRSMVKYLIDKNEQRPIIIFYSNSESSGIAYKDILDKAGAELGIKTVYTLTNLERIPSSWTGQRGFITDQMIIKEVPDYRKRMYYISGPYLMVAGINKVLRGIGVAKKQIKTDFFPGFTASKKAGA